MTNMSSMKCKQCKLKIRCEGGDVTDLKKHIKNEHDVVKYVIDLYLAVNLLTPEEEEQLVQMTKPRLENFRKTGALDTKESIFAANLSESEVTKLQPETNEDLKSQIQNYHIPNPQLLSVVVLGGQRFGIEMLRLLRINTIVLRFEKFS